jgi:hypothetical protein
VDLNVIKCGSLFGITVETPIASPVLECTVHFLHAVTDWAYKLRTQQSTDDLVRQRDEMDQLAASFVTMRSTLTELQGNAHNNAQNNLCLRSLNNPPELSLNVVNTRAILLNN